MPQGGVALGPTCCIRALGAALWAYLLCLVFIYFLGGGLGAAAAAALQKQESAAAAADVGVASVAVGILAAAAPADRDSLMLKHLRVIASSGWATAAAGGVGGEHAGGQVTLSTAPLSACVSGVVK